MDTRDRRDARSVRHALIEPTAPFDPRAGSRAERRALVPETFERRDRTPSSHTIARLTVCLRFSAFASNAQ